MNTNEKIEELEAMVVFLTKRIEKLEKKTRLASYSSYLDELRREAKSLLRIK